MDDGDVPVIAGMLAVGLGAAVALLWLPSLADLWHLLHRRRREIPAAGPQRERLLFLVPAHDEELLIGYCIASLRRQGYPAELLDVLVVADNCTDGTARVARAAGAAVLERHDAEQRGKQHALAWAVQRIDLARHDAIVIVDADTELDPGFAAALASRGPLRDKVVQPFNDVQNRTENALTRMAAVQSQALHGLGFQLKSRTGINVPLSAGMCLGTGVLGAHGWPAFSIGEDFELYVILTLRGVRIDHTTAARVFAQEARDLKQGASQRSRWMAGRWYVLRRYTHPVLTATRIPWRQRLDLLGEMTTTALGPATQLAVTLAVALTAFLSGVPAGRTLAVLAIASLGRHAVYTSLAVARDPEPGRAARAFLQLPPYILWRVGVAVRSLVSSGTGAWVRTTRHGRDP